MDNKRFRKGRVIFEAGGTAPEMYAVLQGVVGIYSNYGKPGERLLNSLHAGQTFGEMALLDDAPRSADAVALEDTVLQVITRDELQGFLQSRPDEVAAILQRMSENLRSLTGKYMTACRTLAEIEDAEEKGEVRGVKTREEMARITEAYYAGLAR